ncbi:hypothetical protein [Mesorhizobium sp.]|uniref:hypothetical protein n=1 Tax=Mesorhizobium sp. TaxID=1871066 RepID=UPI000FEA0D83|nr:hypothetical protein [Mesorhizobium sp.]RWP29514.1 MAG: hypothetical protein EOR03_26675 [Mesorhizobium sp.]RWP69531.1 MAG: hypothetical protein EOR07_03120 [Mesorhizobium sp.]
MTDLFRVNVKPMVRRKAARKAAFEVDTDAIGRLNLDCLDGFKFELEFRMLRIFRPASNIIVRVRENIAFQVAPIAGLQSGNQPLRIAVCVSIRDHDASRP